MFLHLNNHKFLVLACTDIPFSLPRHTYHTYGVSSLIAQRLHRTPRHVIRVNIRACDRVPLVQKGEHGHFLGSQ